MRKAQEVLMVIVVMVVSSMGSASAGLWKKQHAKTRSNSWSSLELSMELFRTVNLSVHLQSKEEAWGEVRMDVSSLPWQTLMTVLTLLCPI